MWSSDFWLNMSRHAYVPLIFKLQVAPLLIWTNGNRFFFLFCFFYYSLHIMCHEVIWKAQILVNLKLIWRKFSRHNLGYALLVRQWWGKERPGPRFRLHSLAHAGTRLGVQLRGVAKALGLLTAMLANCYWLAIIFTSLFWRERLLNL